MGIEKANGYDEFVMRFCCARQNENLQTTFKIK